MDPSTACDFQYTSSGDCLCQAPDGKTMEFEVGWACLLDTELELKSREEPLYPDWVPECCRDFDINFMGDFDPFLVMIILWSVLVAIFLTLFYVRRNLQPLRSRDFYIMALSMLSSTVCLIAFSISYNAGPTGSCFLSLFTYYVFFPFILFFYNVRCVHLTFIYHWSVSKLDTSKSSWYKEHQYILGPKFFMLLLFLQLLLGLVCLAILMIVDYDVYGFEKSVYDTMKCDWWVVPEDHAAMYQAMFNMTLPPYIPHQSSCVHCLSVHMEQAAFLFVYNFSFLFISLYGCYAIHRLNDQLGIMKELISFFAVGIPLGAVALTGLFSDPRDEFDKYTPPPDIVSGLIIIWWGFICSIVYPVVMTFVFEHQQVKHDERLIEMNSISGGGSVLQEVTLEMVLENRGALSLYQHFAVEEFTVENIQYMIAAHELSQVDPKEDPEKFVKQARYIYAVFFKPDSNLEINVPAKIAKQVCKVFQTGTISADDAPAVIEALAPATREIEQLIKRDSWPRFQRTRKYQQVRELLQSDQALSNVMHNLQLDEGTDV
eukprot:Rmarinus@m.11363